MKVIYQVSALALVCLYSSMSAAGDVYSYEKLQGIATAFIKTYEDLIHNQSAATDTEMLIHASEYKGYVGSFLDFEQRDEDLTNSVVKQCLLHATLEEIALNVGYLVVELPPMPNISATENFSLAVHAYCERQIPVDAPA